MYLELIRWFVLTIRIVGLQLLLEVADEEEVRGGVALLVTGPLGVV